MKSNTKGKVKTTKKKVVVAPKKKDPKVKAKRKVPRGTKRGSEYAPPDLEKARRPLPGQTGLFSGPYIGPRGGRWADPQHTIPYKDSSQATVMPGSERTQEIKDLLNLLRSGPFSADKPSLKEPFVAMVDKG